MFRNNLLTMFAGAVLLASCGSSDETTSGSSSTIDPKAYDLAAIEQVVEDGDLLKAIEILKARSQLGLTSSAELMMLADLYLGAGQGVAASVAVEDARKRGLSGRETALTMAKALMLSSELGKAERELALVSLQGETGFEAILLKGDIAQKRERFDEARNLFSVASEIKPASNLPDKALAFMELELGNLELAEKYALSATEKAPEDLTAQYLLGAIKRYQGDADEAEQIFNSILEQEPEYNIALVELAGVYLDKGNYEEVEKLLDVILQVLPNNSVALYYSAALAAHDEEFEEAAKILIRLEELRKTYVPARRLYGYVLYKVGKFDVANSILRNILTIIPEDDFSRRAYADSLIKAGRNAEAVKVLDYFLEKDSTDPAATMQKAVALAGSGKTEEAAEYFARTADTISPKTDEEKSVYSNMVENQAIAEFISGNGDKAISLLQSLAENKYAGSEQLLTLANMQMETGALTDASSTLELLKERDPENIVIHNLAGTLEHRRGNYEQAVVKYSEALAINPHYDSAIKNRAAAYMRMKKYVEANTDLKDLVIRADGDPQVQGMLGESYLELQQYREAIRALDRAVEMLPQSARYALLLTRAYAGNRQLDEAIKQAEATMRIVKGDAEAETYLRKMIIGFKDRKELGE
ncbi:tetratricopeptide repeat protein [Kordiimonas sp. SCSIO 12603]|uniref:tetratricopeptide repeat protein n=1 Tax=Kordiimonas sp. SCSIO 12603 TaxID=2829596 RepID=UPI002103D7C8|nr:tetratricopeptide repeat protein [Kordiimonas sp. SCSIO 12603]UTW58479.1 tetratricopeptide repeat protein [Kordiimonas sp. SCSIO 12603]